MLLLLITFLLSISHATEHAWTEELKQCTNLEPDDANTAEACQAACAADAECEVYQFYNKRRGGDCYKGKYDPEKCFELNGQRNSGKANAGGVKIQEECDVIRAECCGYIRDYDLKPHHTWGRLPRNKRGEWGWRNCNEVVGHTEMTNCPYTCDAVSSSVEQAVSVAVVEGESGSTPMVVNGFALVGFAFLMYGAGKHFFGKPSGDAIDL